MIDKRNWDETTNQKSTAQQALIKAKQKEAKKIAEGARFCRVGRNTYKLNNHGNSTTKILD